MSNNFVALALALTFGALPGFGSELYLTVQPVQICDDSGANCAGEQLFPDITNAIWSQADITVDFLPSETIDNTSYYSGSGFANAFLGGDFTGLAPNSMIDYVYYLPQATLDNSFGDNVLGEGYIGAGLAVVGDGSFEYEAVLSHELGHTLGLSHIQDSAGNFYLMNPMADAQDIGETVSDIFPTGQNDQIPASQIAMARESDLLSDTPPTPEPATAGLVFGGIAFLVFWHRKAVVRPSR